MQRHFFPLALLGLFIAGSYSRGADVLQEVPNDALGFVVVPRLIEFDAKISRLSSELRDSVFSPLAFLKSATGVQEGLNAKNGFLLVLYRDAGKDETKLRFAVWLPVADYARFIKSIGATSIDGISAATIGGEDLLIANRGEWAIIMDPDERNRMTKLLAAAPSPPPRILNWKKWIDANDVTVVASSSGIRELLTWAKKADDAAKPGGEGFDDLFGAAQSPARRHLRVARSANRSASAGLADVLSEFHKWSAASPAIRAAIEQANTVGCGIRLDAGGHSSGNVLASLRVTLNESPEPGPRDAKIDLPFRMYNNGPFVINGAGRLPKSVRVGLASTYLRRIVADMKSEESTELDSASLPQLEAAVEQVAADIRSAIVLTQPGSQPQPIYSNNFVAVRVASATEFVGHAAEVMRLWNKANRDADGEAKLVFSAEDVQLGGRTATQYSLDLAELAGTPVLPDTRQAMEKLFGAGGKMRLWIVPTDDTTVLLAFATPEQVNGILQVLDRKREVSWNRSELADCNRLLPAESDWRVFFDPHHYSDWLGRQALAITGVPVIGGPLVKQFPASPPIGIAGGFRDRELWIEAAALAPTVKSAYTYVTAKKRRPGRPDVAPRLK